MDQCTRCGAKCCTYFCFQLDTPDSYEEFENVRWFLCHEGVTVHIDEGDWYIAIANRCLKLGADNRCTIYDDRPKICRSYSTDGCDFAGGEYDYDRLFSTPEELDAYARETLGKTYDREKAKVRGETPPRKKSRKKSKDKEKGSGKKTPKADAKHKKPTKGKAGSKSKDKLKEKPKGTSKGKAKRQAKG